MRSTLRGLGGRKGAGQFTVPLARLPQDRGMPVWWWIPGRSRARIPDPGFVRQLKSVDQRLDVGWNPEERNWEIWYKSGEKQVPWTNGWKRLLIVSWSDILDNRVFHALYSKDNRAFGSAIGWFNQVEAQRAREKAAAEASHDDESAQMAKDYWNYTKIKSSSHGGKFHRHHAGG